jgi:hypothetical protein
MFCLAYRDPSSAELGVVLATVLSQQQATILSRCVCVIGVISEPTLASASDASCVHCRRVVLQGGQQVSHC